MALVKPTTSNKVVTTAGTRVQLSTTSALCVSMIIQANSANAGAIFVGSSTVSSTVYGTRLTAGNSLTIEMPTMGSGGVYDIDLSNIYIDAATSGDGVSVLFYERANG